MKRFRRVRRPVQIDRRWFGAAEFRPTLRRSWLDDLAALFSRPEIPAN